MKKRIFSVFLILAVLFSLSGCSPANGKSYPVSEYRTTMKYYDDFKILQLTDLHLGIETDLSHQLEIIKNAVRTEEPDLIILTGDNFMYASKGVVKALVSTLNAECEYLTAKRDGRLTKFTLTFGNHDNQGDYPRYFINDVISSYATSDGNEITDKKFAAFIDFEDDDLFGLTNFYIDLVDDRTKSADTVDVKYRLHIIDSNTYHFMGLDYDYDVMHDEQLDHAINVYEQATADKDYVGLAFFHIPLPEYEEVREAYLNAPDPSIIGQGEFRENAMSGYTNNGSYKKLRSANVVAYFCGHDHINYGDFIHNADKSDISVRAIFSFGVKSTNQLYHAKDIMGYKTVTLRDLSVEEFLTVENIRANFKNVTGGYSNYENN